MPERGGPSGSGRDDARSGGRAEVGPGARPPVRGAPTSRDYVSSSAKPVGGAGREVFYWYYVRVSGLLLVFLALFHLYLNHIRTDVGELEYDLVIGRLSEFPLLRVADFLLLFLGLSHGVLGLKALIDDHVHRQGERLWWLSLLYVVFAVFLVAGTAVLWTLPLNGGA